MTMFDAAHMYVTLPFAVQHPWQFASSS